MMIDDLERIVYLTWGLPRVWGLLRHLPKWGHLVGYQNCTELP